MNNREYLESVLTGFNARDLSNYSTDIKKLKRDLKAWAGPCFIAILDSGSRARGTAISIASDVDYLVSLDSSCNENSGGLKSIYDNLYCYLTDRYINIRKQNVSFRINLGGLQVDVTPARKYGGNTNDHNLYVSKKDSWIKTNIQKHINDISISGRRREIQMLKIWRELKRFEFPSIYLEYLAVEKLLYRKSKGPESLEANLISCFKQLSAEVNNPLDARLVDPANSNNILSDLLTDNEKKIVKIAAAVAYDAKCWDIVYG